MSKSDHSQFLTNQMKNYKFFFFHENVSLRMETYGHHKGPIFSKAVLKCRWLLEHENLSKVGKYAGKFLNSISQISQNLLFFEFLGGFCRSLGFFCK